jgi:hypothetical protein
MMKLFRATIRCFGAVAMLLPLFAMAAPSEAPVQAPTTLRDVVATFAEHFDVKIVGLSHIGTESPIWPATELSAPDLLRWLLKNYDYAAVLKPETPGSERPLPDRLFVVGEHKVAADTGSSQPGAANSGQAPPASLAVWGSQPSSVVRNLTAMAVSSAPKAPPGAPGGGAGKAPNAQQPLLSAGENPAESAAAMATLTRSAQSGLSALVTQLRQACQNPKGC